MLTEDQLNLITAGVDGDLTDAEAQRLQRLLDDSSEARKTYDRLRADSIRLQCLPRIEPPADLQRRVMAKIAALGPVLSTTPERHIELERPRGPIKQPRWVPIAIAASLLLAIAGASFLYFKADQDNATIAHQPNRTPSGTEDDPGDLRAFDSVRPPSAPMPSERNASGVAHEAPAPVVAAEKAVAVAPEPRTPDRDLIGAHPRSELPNFDLVQLRLPFLEPLSEFDRVAVRQQLIEELGNEPAFRIDLFARNSLRGVELFQIAARRSGLVVHADGTSMSQLRKGQASSLVVYTDSLTATELTALIARLNSEDAKVSPRVFDAVHATPIAREDESEIRRVLGTDPGLFKRPAVTQNRRKEMPKGGSVSAGTADQIVDSIKAGKGRAVGGSAILMTWAPSLFRTPPATSAELKNYLSKRGERKPDAVPVIIVIRPGNG